MPVAHILMVSALGLSAYERANTTARAPQGLPNPRLAMPRIFITAEIGEGGPTGVYAVRL